MFNLTQEERKVILFLITIALIGLGVDFAAKRNARIKAIVSADVNLAKTDLNQANLEDLLRSRCLGAKLAKKIIEYRNQEGSLRNLEDLKQVKGLSQRRYDKLKELFFVE